MENCTDQEAKERCKCGECKRELGKPHGPIKQKRKLGLKNNQVGMKDLRKEVKKEVESKV